MAHRVATYQWETISDSPHPQIISPARQEL
jgi:hypothetical protein